MHLEEGRLSWDQGKLKDPKYLVTKADCVSGQKLVFGPHMMPGWVCTVHQAYNNIDRERCKFSNCQQKRAFTNEELMQFSISVRAAGGFI